MIFVAFAALISLVSCQKAITPVDGNEEKVVSTITSPVFTASISGATKTTVNVTDGKVAWENDDEITVIDAAAPDKCYILSYGQEGFGFYGYSEKMPLVLHKAYLIFPAHQFAPSLHAVFAGNKAE